MGKVVWISGAGTGIGASIAELLHQQGMQVVLSGRRQQPLEALGFGCALPLNITDPQSIAMAQEHIKERYGTIDALVNNAGVGIFKPIQQLSLQEWHTTLATNLTGAFMLTQAALQLMPPQSHIINIGSMASKNAFAGGTAYNASKYGLLGFSEALMHDLRPLGTRVTTILPGSTNSGSNWSPDQHQNHSWKIRPQDIAQTVLFALNSDPSMSLGQIEIRPTRTKP